MHNNQLPTKTPVELRYNSNTSGFCSIVEDAYYTFVYYQAQIMGVFLHIFKCSLSHVMMSWCQMSPCWTLFLQILGLVLLTVGNALKFTHKGSVSVRVTVATDEQKFYNADDGKVEGAQTDPLADLAYFIWVNLD